MKSLFASSLLLAMSLQCAVAESPTSRLPVLDEPTAQAYKTLKTTSYFAIGGVGYAGMTSEGEKAFRTLLASKKSASAFQALLKEGELPGRLYALLGLHLRDKQAFTSASAFYLKSEAKAPTMSGCIRYETPVAEVVRDIKQGKYDASLRRPIRPASPKAG